jgi:membrane protein implicated in regulation of membrane protease activity
VEVIVGSMLAGFVPFLIAIVFVFLTVSAAVVCNRYLRKREKTNKMVEL